ncbi:MAG: hypothetical protein NC342_05520 [Pseudoflavonifractor sp.]|nr:hypothetical protein [Alloprevotella sp.]MCM1116976.1 hypothetical protein [Pseudoflavonifractor sp.]
MKLNKIGAGLIAMLAVSFASCSEGQYWDEPNYTPAVSFPKPAATVGILADESFDSYDVTVTRSDAAGAASVALTPSTSAPEVFTGIPTVADFPAGSSETTVTIRVNTNEMAIGTTYTLTLAAPEAAETGAGDIQSPAANATFTFKIAKNYTWKNAGWMLYTEAFVGTFYGVEDVTYYVPVQVPEQAEGNGVYRLVNPYGAYYPYNEPGDYSGTSYLEINAQNPAQVYIPTPQEQGMNWGEGKFILGSMAGFYLNKGQSAADIAAAGYFGTLADGKITFPASTLLVGMANYNDGGLYKANGNGSFCLDVASLTTENPYE